MSEAAVESLHLYPVKDCAGIDLAAADVTVTGLCIDGAADREWMVVDETGRFLTQREFPRLALVRTSVADGHLCLAAPHMPDLIVARRRDGPSAEVVVWRSEVRGFDAGDRAAQWLSDWLAHDARLVLFDSTRPRACNPDYVGDSGAHTYFADGYPVLVAGTAALDDLNLRLAQRRESPLPMNRFRPNVVIAGCPAFAEDTWSRVRIGEAVFRAAGPCARCIITTTDQATAVRYKEPLRTLATYRRDATDPTYVNFGQNLIHETKAGTIRVGDAVTPLD